MFFKAATSALIAVLAVATVTGAAAASDASGPPRGNPGGHGTTMVLGGPLEGTHAHNDYEHERPLFDALEHGFTSVEVDVWLVDGELLVAHSLADVRPGVTLESLYLDPLTDLVHGKSVYPGWDGSLQLLIDIKSEAETTYAAIETELAAHRGIMSRFDNGTTKTGAVTAVVSGNRPLATMQAQQERFSFYDGRSGDLSMGIPASLMPLVSDNWTKLYTWNGEGEMPDAERAKLTAYVEAAHTQGYRVRFWATPDAAGPARDALWTELHAAGVDNINTDDLAGLQEFLTNINLSATSTD
ncbi:MAG: phosphatidylinositol-specific phospholipase C/glycerophosphodiester phosphodiesterase family protein [Cryobacterium sp.]|uniref:phosphatidylinositol-specific phospholipase C/glycerophosphodiester phosphodiesterase family protein n=1 Tax=unclassified Cryobacterium TaxID=2649013 RepID=UPI0018C97073|nr:MULTISPECIES: phosphatidylinositol-specific phospholipase C/glycerophosphodiester phosphodiesterase family protein [unclassified Cryobacterium]MCY7403093.1 phosphatidylinositol-specific phospholipase C/glycerophosphodiester phosphodiesterase family protein [Cryobacterium sp.]MEC5152779.1 hypothetical protein [Cryobacterium sp. CAN_C3]